jgi:ABC-type nitrate/sulfonate/bicarbonate transport system ATPase subunit
MRPQESQLKPPATAPRLECRGLTKVFPSPAGPLAALGPVDLSVAAGEFVALVGPSGCGKSTLFNVVAGLELPTSGEALVDGVSVVGRPGAAAYMPQKDLLLPWLRVLDNTALPLELAGARRADARSSAAGHFPRFGLAGFERSWPWQLSGGMRQRAALLRTYLVDRDLLLLDEPFGALDALTRGEMQEWLLGVWAESRRTVLFVTHDVEEALFLADRVYVMSPRPGRIVTEVASSFPRPRTFHLTGDPAFAQTKERLLALLHEPAVAA